MRVSLRMMVAALALGAPALVAAQSIIVYPAQGQSPDQQNRDTFECQQWATNQTGFNPQMAAQQHAQAQQQIQASAAAAPPPPSGQGMVARGAARGAVIGGIAGGNAGRGAAAGAMMGGVRRANQQQQAAQMQQQQAAQAQQQSQQVNAQYQQGLANYNRAVGTCMQGRGYTVN